jgi:hypothetical protein
MLQITNIVVKLLNSELKKTNVNEVCFEIRIGAKLKWKQNLFFFIFGAEN